MFKFKRSFSHLLFKVFVQLIKLLPFAADFELGFHTGNQFEAIERFVDIVICTQLKSFNNACSIGFGC